MTLNRAFIRQNNLLKELSLSARLQDFLDHAAPRRWRSAQRRIGFLDELPRPPKNKEPTAAAVALVRCLRCKELPLLSRPPKFLSDGNVPYKLQQNIDGRGTVSCSS